MKRLLYIGFPLIVITIGCFFTFNRITENRKNDLEKTYYIDLPDGLDTLDFKASLTLDKTKKFHKIKFPSGGTSTSVSINESDYLENAQKRIKDKPPLRDGYFSNEQEVVLDISHLKRGDYYVHFSSCNLGGIFPLEIK
jgi:hypothetical protein